MRPGLFALCMFCLVARIVAVGTTEERPAR